MAMDRLTVKAREAISDAVRIASSSRNTYIEPVHLLKALALQEEGTTRPLLEKLGASPDAVAKAADDAISRLPKVSGSAGNYMGDELNILIRSAEDAASELKDEYVSTEHFLIAMAKSASDAGRLLNDAGATHSRILEALKEIRGSQRVTDENPETSTRRWSGIQGILPSLRAAGSWTR